MSIYTSRSKPRPLLDLRALFLLLLTAVILTFVLSYIFFNGTIDIMREALSDLGALETAECECNRTSQIIFSSGMGVCSLIMALISLEFRKWRGMRFRGSMVNMSRVSSAGFAMLMMPTDGIRVIHLTGVFLAIGGLWVLTIFMLHEVKEHFGRLTFWSLHLILDAAVLSYLFEGLIYMGSRTYFQKVGFFFLALVSLISLEKLYENISRYHHGSAR